MRELRQVVFKDDGLHQVTWDLLRAISLVQEQNHGLVLVVLFEAVVEGADVEDATFALGLGLSILTDDNVRWQLELCPDHMLEVIKALRKLEDEMEADETLTEHHDCMPVHMQGVAKFEHIVLENVDDLRCKLVCVAFGPFNCCLQLQQENVACWLVEVLAKLFELVKDAVQFGEWDLLFEVGYDDVIYHNTKYADHVNSVIER